MSKLTIDLEEFPWPPDTPLRVGDPVFLTVRGMITRHEVKAVDASGHDGTQFLPGGAEVEILISEVSPS